MSKASIETLLIQLNSGKEKMDKARVFRFIKRNRLATKEDVIRELNLSHQTATARLTSLQDEGVLEIKGMVVTISGKLSMYEVQEDPVKIAQNVHERLSKKYKKWLKAGEKFKDFVL